MNKNWWHPLAGVVMTLAVCAAAVLLTGCKPTNQAKPASVPDGITQLTKAMLGFWDAPGGTECRWWISDTAKGIGGTIADNGNTKRVNRSRIQKPGRAADQSQTLLVSTGKVGLYLHSDNCGPWKHR